ncbi:MAG: hypothetical protein AAB409_03595 [Gemmatimonadota bacterium]
MTSAAITGPLDLLWALGAIAAIFAVIAWRERRRSRAMAAVAETLGLTFEANVDAQGTVAALRALADVPLLGRRFHQSSTNAMAGRRGGREVRVFDFTFRHRKRGRGYTELTVVLLPGGGAGLPDFVLAPENVLQKLGEVFGCEDIDFLTHSEFSERYHLRGADEAAIRRAFSAEALETIGRECGWHVEVANGHLAAYRGTKRLSPKKVPDLVDGTLRIVEMLAPR